jgi:hypothetical protein
MYVPNVLCLALDKLDIWYEDEHFCPAKQTHSSACGEKECD